MSTTVDGPTDLSLPDETRQAIRDQLQPTLVELLDLALVAKQLHWTVTGPHFRSLHLQLDELVDAYRTWADEVAERMAAVGIVPDGRPQRVAGDSPFDPAPDGWTDGSAVIEIMVGRIGRVAAAARERVAALDGIDLASQDVLLGVLKGLEEQRWMLDAQRR